MQLTLSSSERKLLARLLERELGDVRAEVRRSRAPAFRDPLETERDALAVLLERLRGSETTPG